MPVEQHEREQAAHASIAVIKGMNAKEIENEQHHQHQGIIVLLSYGFVVRLTKFHYQLIINMLR